MFIFCVVLERRLFSRTPTSKSYFKSYKKKIQFRLRVCPVKRTKSVKIVLILKRDEYEIKWSERSLLTPPPPAHKNGQRRVSPRGVLLSRDKLTVLYLYSFTFHSSLSLSHFSRLSLSLALFCDPIGKSQMYRIKKFILFDGMAAPLALSSPLWSSSFSLSLAQYVPHTTLENTPPYPPPTHTQVHSRRKIIQRTKNQ